jgi:hypothetical protein
MHVLFVVLCSLPIPAGICAVVVHLDLEYHLGRTLVQMLHGCRVAKTVDIQQLVAGGVAAGAVACLLRSLLCASE